METYSHIGGYSYPARVYGIRRAVGQNENPITFKRQLEEEGSITRQSRQSWRETEETWKVC